MDSTTVTTYVLPNRYFLLQHLKRDEAILPGTKQLGLFRATEIVYPRSSVVPVKSAENYYRFGIVVKEGEEPMKMVKKRTVTINKKRAEAAALYDGMEVEQDALYAASQTELYVPPPIVDVSDSFYLEIVYDKLTISLDRVKFLKTISVILIFLYLRCFQLEQYIFLVSFSAMILQCNTNNSIVSSDKGAAKCAKSLGIDYADAIVSLEFFIFDRIESNTLISIDWI